MNARSVLVLAASVLMLAGIVQAQQVLLSEDFESYADQAAFQAAWPSIYANGSSMLLQPVDELADIRAHSGTKSVSGFASSNNQQSNYRYLPTKNVVPTDAQQLIVSAWFNHDAVATRNFIEFRGWSGDEVPALPYTGAVGSDGVSNINTGIQSLLAMGEYNTPVASHWYGRAWGGGNGSAWIDLGVAVTDGWHEIKAVISSRKIEWFVDGALKVETTLTADWAGFDAAILGGRISSGGDGFVDDIGVVVTPEPMTVALLGLGGLMLRRRRTA